MKAETLEHALAEAIARRLTGGHPCREPQGR